MTQTLDLDGAAGTRPPVQRTFVDWSEPFLPAVAGLLARAYGSGGGMRMSRALVVVPGARAGRRLKELLLTESERAGRRLEPPRIVTTGALPELLWRGEAPLASATLALRSWVLALRALPAERSRALLPEPPGAGDVRGWTRLARVVAGLHSEVSGGGLTFRDVADRTGEDPLFDDESRWRVLATAQEAYGQLLDSFGFADVGLSRIAAVEAGEVEIDADLWLVGVVEMPDVLRSMLRDLRAAAPVRALVHAPESEAAGFDDLGCVAPGGWAGRNIEIPEEALAVRGRPSDQADEVVRSLSGLGGRFAADEITVAVPDDEVLPYVEQRMESAGVPVRRSTGARVGRTPALRLLEALADYIDGHRYDSCAALARHPDLWRWIRRTSDTRRDAASGAFGTAGSWVGTLDEHYSDRLPARLHPDGVIGSDTAATVVRALCRTLDALLGRLRGTRRIGEWMPDILEIVLEVYGDAELDRSRPDHREMIEALGALHKGAAALHDLPAAADEEVDAATAVRLLLDEVAGQTIAPPAGDAAVELLGWLEVHLDDAPVTIVTGFNEGTLPESINAHPYLPDSVRTRIGLTDNQTRYARDAYQLTALLHSRAELRLIAGRQSVRGDPLRPSRLMFAISGPALARRVKRFYGDGAASGRPVTGRDAPDDAPNGRSSFNLPPERRLVAPVPIQRLSVRQFGEVLADPYLFALRAVHGLETIDDAATELDGRGFGNLAHLVLQRFGESDAAAATDADEINERLDRLLVAAVEERHGSDSLPAVRLQVEQLRARLRSFARWQADWAADGWRIHAVECRTPAEGVVLMVDDEPFTISGRIDRIDRNERLGAWAVFDYKTGDRAEEPDRTHRKGRGPERAWVDLQLPLYRHILPHVLNAAGERPFAPGRADDVRLGYILLPRDAAAAGASFASWTDAELDEAEEAARDVVRLVRRGEFTWNPEAPRRVRDPRLAALLGIGYLEAAAAAEEAEGTDV